MAEVARFISERSVVHPWRETARIWREPLAKLWVKDKRARGMMMKNQTRNMIKWTMDGETRGERRMIKWSREAGIGAVA